MRKIISAMQISVDGFIEDPEGKQDWVDNWEDDYGMPERADMCLLGGTAYEGGYEQYWTSILEDPTALLPSGKTPTEKEIHYAQWAAKTPHVVLSRTPLHANWRNTTVIHDIEEVRRLKQEPGKDIYVVGGAAIVSSLLNAGLVDEIQLMVNPVLLAGGKALFKDVTERHVLKLESAKTLGKRVHMVYTVRSE